MATSNPKLVSDLIAKYGWQIMPYLSTLGTLLSDAQVLLVDGNHANTLDADDQQHGLSWNTPLATIDYAVGLQVAGAGGVILVAPGHAETLSGAADLDIDVSGITIIGLGEGSMRPTLTLGGTDATTTIEINGDDITVKNLRIVGGDTDGTTVAIDIKTGSDYVTLDGLEFFETVNTKEILTGITVEDKCDQLTIKNCIFRNLASGDNLAAIITEADEHDFLVIENCQFIGDWTNAILDLDAAALVAPTIKDCLLVNYDATAGDAIDLNSGTKALIVNCMIASGKGDAYPIADISASYVLGCLGAEPGTYGVAAVNATGANFGA